MNDWILPQTEEKISEIEEHQANKKLETEENSFLENMLPPNYVLIDAALWSADISIFLEDSTITYKSLFRGSSGEKLWSVAPYLIDVSSNDELVKSIKRKDPIERRVTWLYSTENIEDLRKHLRRFLRMKQGDDSYIYFRFYDPYVVNAVFPNFTNEQAIDFFEKIEYIVTEDARIGKKQIFRLSSRKELHIISQKIDSYVDNIR